MKSTRITFALRATAAFALILFLFTGSGAWAADPVHLTILHMNDTHGHILPFMDKSARPDGNVGGAAYFAEIIARERKKNSDGSILLSAGDMFQGTPVSNTFFGRPMIDIMNYLGFNAMVLGNHEFDWGQPTMLQLASSARFPFLSANVSSKGGPLGGVAPYVTINRKGVLIAVIGVTTPETPFATKAGNVTGLTFADPAEVLPGIIDEATAEGAEMIVVLSHLGLQADRELARKVKGIHAIVGGHSHTVVPEPVNESGTLIVQAGYYGIYLGVLDVEFDPAEKKIVDYRKKDELVPVFSGPSEPFDPEVARIVENYQKQVKAEFTRVVGSSDVDLARDKQKESNLGNLVADAMRESSGAHVAIENGGGIREDLPRGPITLEMMYSMLPFDNVLVTMELTGTQLRDVLEHGMRLERVVQVSGITMEYDPSRPTGEKVFKVLIGKEPLRFEATYRVTVNDFMATGGDGFEMLRNGKNVQVGGGLRDATLDFLSKHSPVNPRVEDRIVIK